MPWPRHQDELTQLGWIQRNKLWEQARRLKFLKLLNNYRPEAKVTRAHNACKYSGMLPTPNHAQHHLAVISSPNQIEVGTYEVEGGSSWCFCVRDMNGEQWERLLKVLGNAGHCARGDNLSALLVLVKRHVWHGWGSGFYAHAPFALRGIFFYFLPSELAEHECTYISTYFFTWLNISWKRGPALC